MSRLLPRHLPRAIVVKCSLALIVFWCFVTTAFAKEVPVTGVLVYGPSGALAYVQVSGFLINGKQELRACQGSGGIDKSAYKGLAKISLASVKSIERLADGSLVAEIGDARASCVVPGNFKFEKDAMLSPADLAEKSTYSGQVVGSSIPGISQLPPFAPGVKLAFGAANDTEAAEFILARRSQTIASWQGYLTRFPAGAHITQARTGLVALLVAGGNEKLKTYKASSASTSPEYASLKQARVWADQATDLQPGDDDAVKLRNAVRVELKAIADKASSLLQDYHQAITKHARGYNLLLSAKDLSDQLSTVDAKYPPAITLASSVSAETHSLDSLVSTANNQISSLQYDDAYNTITKVVSFADEEPRVGKIVDTVYKYHVDKGNSEVTATDWKAAVVDFRAAAEIKPSDESKGALAKAEAGLLDAQNHAAADKATAVSKDRADAKDFIAAYEVLADLPEAQRALVKDQMTALEAPYVQSATAQAKELQAAHTPIKGRADEDAVRQAYAYLERASKISDNAEIQLKLELLSDTISTYYVETAKKYLSKPLSSGVGLGWSFLTEASLYKPNLDTVRDAMTSSSAAYQMRARLSIGVLFRDQTSRRDSAGFADQLQQAFATGLETSGLPVRVILPNASGPLDPNFQFIGEILEHRTIRNAKKDTLQSQYRSGSREIPSEAWNKADQIFEGANLDLQRAQNALSSAQVKKNKKQIEAAEQAVTDAQARVQDARAKMNALPKTTTQDVVNPYNYTRTSLEVKNIVELSFQIKDATGSVVGAPIRVIKGDQPKKFTVLENIKPDDTTGLKEIDSAPDELQLMTDVEIEARDTMVKAARDKVQELPQQILAEARSKAAANDFDGAGELYVLYLNCAPVERSKERAEGVQFLRDRFNLHSTENLRASVK